MSDFIIRQAFAEALDLHKREQFDEAKQIYKKILSVEESNPNANHLISLIYMVEGKHEDAKKHIEKAIEKEPDQAIFHSNYGALLQAMGKIKDAIRTYKKSLKIDKKCFQSHYSLGVLYADRQEFDKAVESYTNALGIENDSPQVHNNLANIYSTLNNPKAELHYQKTINLLPEETYPRLNMSNYLIKQKNFEGSKKILEELIHADLATEEVFNNLGITYKGLNNNEKASEMFKEALKLNPKYSLAKKNLESLPKLDDGFHLYQSPTTDDD